MKKVLEALTQMQIKMPIQTIILVLLVAFMLSLVVYLTYKYTYDGVLYNPRFNMSLIMITMITTIVMIVIGSNISVSLGMVGALSIVRFRTAVKDPRDTAFLFWCIVLGLACGTQNYSVAIIGSLFLCMILFLFKKLMLGNRRYVLIVKGNNVSSAKVEMILDKKKYGYICKSKYVSGSDVELIYEVKFKKKVDNNLIDHIKQLDNVSVVNLVQSNSETMG